MEISGLFWKRFITSSTQKYTCFMNLLFLQKDIIKYLIHKRHNKKNAITKKISGGVLGILSKIFHDNTYLRLSFNMERRERR